MNAGNIEPVVQVINPARLKLNIAGDCMNLAFTDLNERVYQGPAPRARPLATISPSVAGSQSSMSVQRSVSGRGFDICTCALPLLQHLLCWIGFLATESLAAAVTE
jgi:hypothetical protein